MSEIDYSKLSPEIVKTIQSYKDSKGPERGLFVIYQKTQQGQNLGEGERDVFLRFVTGMETLYSSNKSGGGLPEASQKAFDSLFLNKGKRDLVDKLKPKLEKLGYKKKKGRFSFL